MTSGSRRLFKTTLAILGGVSTLIALIVSCSWIWSAQIMSYSGPTWRGITVGHSTSDDVVATLGTATSIVQQAGRTEYLYQDGRFEWGVHRIIVHNGTVEQITENMSAYFPKKVGLLQFVDLYGTPDYVMWSQEGQEFRTVIFLEEGVFVTVTAVPLEETQVTRAFYYQPRSLVRLLVDFRGEISSVEPDPGSDIVGKTRDPWFGTPDLGFTIP
jgi:hypothetical protein